MINAGGWGVEIPKMDSHIQIEVVKKTKMDSPPFKFSFWKYKEWKGGCFLKFRARQETRKWKGCENGSI